MSYASQKVGGKGICSSLKNCADARTCCQKRRDFVEEQVLTADSLVATGCFPAVDSPSQFDTDFGFKTAMSADGNVLVVGAPSYDATAARSGAVFVFERRVSFAACLDTTTQDGKFHLVQVLKLDNPVEDDRFGNSVAVSGDGNRIAVSVPKKSVETISGAGVVYIYQRNAKQCGPSLWNIVQEIHDVKRTSATDCTVISAAEEGAFFGYNIALSRNGLILAVSSTASDYSSSITLFEACPTFFSNCSKPVYKLAQRIDQAQVIADLNDPTLTLKTLRSIGLSLAISGDGSTVTFSGYEATANGLEFSGRVFVYIRNHQPSSWRFSQQLIASDDRLFAGTHFGFSIAVTPCAQYLAVESYSGNKDVNGNGYVAVFKKQKNGQYVQDGNDMGPIVNDVNFHTNSLSIADSGCIVAVGYEGTNVSEFIQAGVVDVYERTQNGSETVWTLKQVLNESPLRNDAGFGIGLAMDALGLTIAAAAAGTEGGFDPDVVHVFQSSFICK